MPTKTEMGAKEFDYNSNGTKEGKWQQGTALTKQTKLTYRAKYDFATSGGAVGAITLLGEDGKAASLPKSALITDAFIDVITAPTSGGSATIAFGAASTNDVKTATAIASVTGVVACIPVGTAASAIKLAADCAPSITVAVAALTAGKFYVLFEYYLSETT